VSTPSELDDEMMLKALNLGKLGEPSPNPHVGCIIADGSEVIGEGYHEAVGLDHAEAVALKHAGDKARGKTLYVSLEPCNHHGRTSPCVDAIVQAGLKRVVVGCRDPNPGVEGGGIERLQAAGIEVSVGVKEEEARELIRAWEKYITRRETYLTLKLALSLDGRIATRTGDSQWVTGEASQKRVHLLRAEHDAVMVGINTVLADDPLLTVRHVHGTSPARVVIDSNLRIPLNSRLVETAHDAPTCVVTTDAGSRALAEALEEKGLSVIRVPATAQGRCDMAVTLRELAAREVVSVLCEGGAELAGSLLATRLADELHAFIAPLMLGPRGRPGAVDWAGPATLAEAPHIARPHWELCGVDAHVWGKLVYPERVAQQPETE
jgi:diaminohydroxyphosphoribosylaminopyrimidine deaminase/5-amino-6-(5-phosphoribosylamino)uracil reductase